MDEMKQKDLDEERPDDIEDSSSSRDSCSFDPNMMGEKRGAAVDNVFKGPPQ